MNENTFQSQRNHTRLKFQPLTTSCQLKCMTPDAPCAQSLVVSGGTSTYNPNRMATPTVIMPYVRASDPDGVFTRGAVNEFLSLETMQWLMNDNPIDDEWTLNTDYVINTSATDVRGMLTIYKNLPPSESATLRFKGTFVDWRTQAIYEVESDEIMLITTEKGEDIIACSLDKPYIEYDPIYDDLLLFDHLLSIGQVSAGQRSSYINGKSYEQTILATLTKGTTELSVLPSDITMRVVRLGQSTALVPNSEASPELLQASFPTIKFDMRVIDNADYEVQFLRSGSVIASAPIGLHQKTTMPLNGKPLRNADIVPSLTLYRNKALLNLANKMIVYPEVYYLIRWFTRAVVASVVNGVTSYSYGQPKEWQRGENMQAPVREIGIGSTFNDSFFEQWFEVDAHGASDLLADETNDVLTDESGEMLID